MAQSLFPDNPCHQTLTTGAAVRENENGGVVAVVAVFEHVCEESHAPGPLLFLWVPGAVGHYCSYCI